MINLPPHKIFSKIFLSISGEKMEEDIFETVMGVIGVFYQWAEKQTDKNILEILDKNAISVYKKYAESFEGDDLKEFLEGFYGELVEKYKSPIKRKVNFYAIIIPTLFDLHEDNETLMNELDEKGLSSPDLVVKLLIANEDINFDDDSYIAEVFGFKRMIENLIEKAKKEN